MVDSHYPTRLVGPCPTEGCLTHRIPEAKRLATQRRSTLHSKWLTLTLALTPSGCFVDTESPCRENEVFDETGMVCACEEGYALTVDGCTKCGKNQVVQAGACVCEEGYSKSGDTCTKMEAPAPTTAVDGGADATPDTDPENDLAQLSAEGEGTACTGDDQCSAFPDAKSCDAFVMACSIKNCSLSPDNCPDEYACCDVSAFAPGAPNVCIKGGCPTF